MNLRQERAKKVLALDDLVVGQVEMLRSRGLTSPYLKSFVVARVNTIRFRPKDAAPLSFDEALDRMVQAAAKFKPETIKSEDLVRAGGVSDDAE
jgi:ParB family chromosome partitioning protein